MSVFNQYLLPGTTPYLAHIKREKIKSQARLAERTNHYAWAAIMWRRAKLPEEAERCEMVITKVAISNITLPIMRAVVLSGVK